MAITLGDSDTLRGHGRHGGPGGSGGGGPIARDAAADALGLSEDELREALAVDDATLAGVAADQGVETSTLVDALVAAATKRIEQGVADRLLTQAQAEKMTAALPARVAAAVEEELRRGHGHGPGGRGRRGGGARRDDDGGCHRSHGGVGAGLTADGVSTRCPSRSV